MMANAMLWACSHKAKQMHPIFAPNPVQYIPKVTPNPSLTPSPPPNPNRLLLLLLPPPSATASPESMALTLCARSKQRSLSNPSLLRFFSSSTPTNPPPPPPPQKDQQQEQPQSSSSFSSLYFSDVKASLKQRQQRNPQTQNQNPPGFSPPSLRSLLGPETPPSGTNQVASPEEIRKNLSGYRSRSPSPFQQQQHQPISMQEVFKRNVVNRQSEGGSGGGFSSKPLSGKLSFDVIRDSLRQMKANTGEGDRKSRDGNNASSFSPFRTSFQPKRSEGGNGGVKPNVIGGSEGLPVSLFGKETSQTEDREKTTSTEFWRMYTHVELGEKLRALRPEVKEGDKRGSFSLEELNERLRRLREMEQKETESRISGVTFKELRESLVKLQNSEDEKAKKNSFHRWNVMGALGATPDFMLQPPKENLVEKYFHPDNMSSAEKMKVELAKVREEFKMSESDCGSARVQVAQLTTKIKHLSSVLHKKDKHSRKGLQAMVQKRKKLLKYLRRTDWDSYCFVLSELGLRDNPEYKN